MKITVSMGSRAELPDHLEPGEYELTRIEPDYKGRYYYGLQGREHTIYRVERVSNNRVYALVIAAPKDVLYVGGRIGTKFNFPLEMMDRVIPAREIEMVDTTKA